MMLRATTKERFWGVYSQSFCRGRLMAVSPARWALLLINKGAIAVNLRSIFNGRDTATVGGSKGCHFVTSGSTSGTKDPMQAFSLDDGRWR